MHLDYIILIVAFRYLQTHEDTKNKYPEWKKYFLFGMLISIALLVLQSVIEEVRPFTAWLAYIVLFGLVYLSYNQKEFAALKSNINAFLPLVVVHCLESLSKLFGNSFYDAIDEYTGAAGFFAFVWMVAMLILNRRQRKAQEKERLIALEKEKEYKRTQVLKAELEKQVAERTAEITKQKEELLHALNNLKSAQTQLIHAEKMASLGELTAGIAHEIQNPLNFVNNFSEVNGELIDEMYEELDKGDFEEVKAIAHNIKENLKKINHHGKRADAIVKGMLLHSRTNQSAKEPTDINALCDEYLRLSYHGLRAKDKTFNAKYELSLDPTMPMIEVMPQDIGRVFLNLINNAFYAVSERKKRGDENYEPKVSIRTKVESKNVTVRITDNGVGIPKEVQEKIFHPFFTTKPTGHGTGLGLSISYDIIKTHGGNITLKSTVNKETEFIVEIPINK